MWPFRGILMKRSESLSRRMMTCATPFLALSDEAATRLSIRSVAAVLSGAAALALAGCAEQPRYYSHGREYFPSSIYGQASPRVVADGQAIPHGGGTYKVGRPYTVAGRTYYPRDYRRYSGVGLASWYGDAFHGRRTANGEIYNRNSITAAHPTMPLPSYARVTNLRNHYSIIVRVNDRGPFTGNRIMDVSRRVAELLEFRKRGTTKVRVDYIGPASLAGSDDAKLAATLREDGRLAQIDMRHPPTYVADDSAPIHTASADIETPSRQPAAEAEPTPVRQQVADASPADLSASEAVFTGPTPLPPSRPFDLDTIPGADVPISATLSER